MNGNDVVALSPSHPRLLPPPPLPPIAHESPVPAGLGRLSCALPPPPAAPLRSYAGYAHSRSLAHKQTHCGNVMPASRGSLVGGGGGCGDGDRGGGSGCVLVDTFLVMCGVIRVSGCAGGG